MNAADEEARIRNQPARSAIRDAIARLHANGVTPDEMRALLGRLLVMPVFTAHPTETRRRVVVDRLTAVSKAFDRLNDPPLDARGREEALLHLRDQIQELRATDEMKTTRPAPASEVKGGLRVFERSLLQETPGIYRELEAALAAEYPGESFTVKPFLRFGTWIGGDRDGNPNITADVTRAALDEQRAVALSAHRKEIDALEHDLPASQKDKLDAIRARLQATRDRGPGGYKDAAAYLADLRAVESALLASGQEKLARGRLHDSIRSAEVFGFDLASMDLRQHSSVHEAAVNEILTRAGITNYSELSEEARQKLLVERLGGTVSAGDRATLSESTRDVLATLDAFGQARRESGAETARYVVSFTRAPSDLLEVLFLARAAGLAPDEIKPVPLLEQLEDLERAEPLSRRLLELPPMRDALRGELEVMLGYSDSGKQAGFVSSANTLRLAQEALARVASAFGFTLTIFHGRGGETGRGGGPVERGIGAQPREALAGRFRQTEQGETITDRYGRPENARRVLENMVSAVLLASSKKDRTATDPRLEKALDGASKAARAVYDALLADRELLTHYLEKATPLREIATLPIDSRPAFRKTNLTFEDLRAIPWVSSWIQNRNGVPGWFGLGTALSTMDREAARELHDRSEFFRALVDNAEVALASTDMEVAARYASLGGPDALAVLEKIKTEHARTVELVLATKRQKTLLEGSPLAETINQKTPYIEVLNQAQIELLGRRQHASDADERARIHDVLSRTVKGLSAGLKNGDAVAPGNLDRGFKRGGSVGIDGALGLTNEHLNDRVHGEAVKVEAER